MLAAGELALPLLAESRAVDAARSATGATPWHPEHIAERYGLLTLIVLGEVILGITGAFAPALSERGFSIPLLLLGIGGLLVVVGIWWIYFLAGDDEGLTSQRVAYLWGYGHYVVFAGVAATGAGLEVAVDAEEHTSHVSATVAGFAVAVPIALVLLVLTALRRLTWASGSLAFGWVGSGVVGVLVCAGLAGVVGIGVSVLLMGLVLAAMLVGYLLLLRRRAAVPPEPRSAAGVGCRPSRPASRSIAGADVDGHARRRERQVIAALRREHRLGERRSRPARGRPAALLGPDRSRRPRPTRAPAPRPSGAARRPGPGRCRTGW